MARYQRPPDPRKTKLRQKPSSAVGQTEPIPWVWLLLGVLVTIISIMFVLVMARAFLQKPPLMVSGVEVSPVVVRLTAEPSRIPTLTPVQPTPTPIPTFTPIPTPDVSVAPPELTVGYYAEVVADIGVTVRGGPGTQNIVVTIAEFETKMLVLDGPTTGGDFEWWQIRLPDGVEGWVAGDFIAPTTAP